jgi:hypothetical protein
LIFDFSVGVILDLSTVFYKILGLSIEFYENLGILRNIKMTQNFPESVNISPRPVN